MTTPHETELKTLMLASRRGDAAAYRVLLAKLAPRLRAYYERRLTGVGHGAEKAEDLVRETLLAIHLKRHTYDSDSPFTPWLHAIARYRLIDHLRSNKMSQKHVLIDDHQELTAADDHASTEVTLEGENGAETVARYNASVSKVKISILRGLKMLASPIGRDSDT